MIGTGPYRPQATELWAVGSDGPFSPIYSWEPDLMQTKTRNIIIVSAIIIAIASSAAFATTVYNPPTTVAPAWSWQYLNGDGDTISNIHATTITGIVTFKATVTNVPAPPVTSVSLVIEKVDGTYVGEWYFEKTSQATSGEHWQLILDTATIANGDYNFVFTYCASDGAGGNDDIEDEMFSTLTFSFNNGNGSSTEFQIPDTLLFVIVGGGIFLFAVLIFRRKRR